MCAHPLLLLCFVLTDNLTPQIRGHIRDMYPPPVTLKDELGEAYLPLALHLLYEVEQAAVIRLVACDDVSSAAQEVVTVLCSTHERVEFLAAVATGHHYRLAPRLAYGVEQLLHEHVQQMVCTLGRAVVDALTQRRSAGGQFGNGKIGGLLLTLPTFRSTPEGAEVKEGRFRPHGSMLCCHNVYSLFATMIVAPSPWERDGVRLLLSLLV